MQTEREIEAKKILCEIKGIGPWTVENFLLFTGENKDICPANDLGVKKGIKKIYKLDDLPSDEEVYAISEKWKPWRTVACCYMWRTVDPEPVAPWRPVAPVAPSGSPLGP